MIHGRIAPKDDTPMRYCNPYTKQTVAKTLPTISGKSWVQSPGWFCNGVFILRTDKKTKVKIVKDSIQIFDEKMKNNEGFEKSLVWQHFNFGLTKPKCDQLTTKYMYTEKLWIGRPIAELFETNEVQQPLIYLENPHGEWTVVNAYYFDLIKTHYPKAICTFEKGESPLYFWDPVQPEAIGDRAACEFYGTLNPALTRTELQYNLVAILMPMMKLQHLFENLIQPRVKEFKEGV